MKTEIKGYELSTDYKKLWDLIHQGYRIPGWIVYSRQYEDPISDLVEVKMRYMSDEHYDIGYRGHSFSSYRKTFEAFEEDCKRIELRWIVFNAPEPII